MGGWQVSQSHGAGSMQAPATSGQILSLTIKIYTRLAAMGGKNCAKGWFSKFESKLMFLPRELSFWLCWQFSHSHALDFFGDKLRCVVRWQGRSQVFNLRPRNSPVLITINPRSVLKLLQYIVASQTLHMREESGSLWLWCNYEEVKKALTQPRKTLMHDEIEHKECDGDDFYNIVIVYWYCILCPWW